MKIMIYLYLYFFGVHIFQKNVKNSPSSIFIDLQLDEEQGIVHAIYVKVI